jgi:hypothetical protein
VGGGLRRCTLRFEGGWDLVFGRCMICFEGIALGWAELYAFLSLCELCFSRKLGR